MVINAYFDNVLVYNVDSKLDVVAGTSFSLEMDAENVEVFSNNDKVLTLDHSEKWVEVIASEVGSSTVRFMDGTSIVKDLLIRVVESIERPASELGTSFGEPVNK